MRNLITLLCIFISTCVLSQNEYPKFEVDSLGQKLVVMTIEQAQKLDNNSELLGMFEKLNQQMSGYDSVCMQVVNDKEVVISEQKVLISELYNNIDIKSKEIKTLQKEVSEYKLREDLANEQLINLKGQIEIKDDQIKKLKTKMFIGGGVGTISIILLVLSIL